jgi:hypothetical protein
MGLGAWTDPRIATHLLRDEGEVIVDEVRHHWCAYVRAVVEALAGWLALREHRDRFVITNMRVFRVHGVLSQSLATMPLTRILDITVRRPLHGRMLGFGHFCFESAAQEQGIRDVRYVGRPYERDLAIQRVVQRSGLRGTRIN